MGRLDNRNFKLFKKNLITAQFKALNENLITAQFKALNGRISEWAYFLNLDKQFQRYLHFSVPKKEVLWTRVKGELHTWSGTKNRTFDDFL